MLLDNTNRTIQVLLSAAAASDDLPVVVAYTDITTSALTPGVQVSESNGTTGVDILDSPGASTQRKVNNLSVYNADSTAQTVTIRYDDNGTTYNIFRYRLQIGESLCYTDREGFYVTPGANKGRLIRTVVLTSGSSHTTSPGCNTLLARLQAAGGAGGGGATGVGQGGQGGGGSAGGYAEKLYAVSPDTAYTYAIGTGGTAGTAGNNPGNAGGDTTFTDGVTTVTAFGGLGGTGMAAGSTTLHSLGGASPAVSTNGDLNAGGMPGGSSTRSSGTVGVSGIGGSCLFGAGGNGLITQGTGNTATVGYGGGGGGGNCLNNGGNVAGGAGANGVIVVYEFS